MSKSKANDASLTADSINEELFKMRVRQAQFSAHDSSLDMENYLKTEEDLNSPVGFSKARGN